MTKQELKVVIKREIQLYLDGSSHFSVLIYFANLPYLIISLFLKVLIRASKRNVLSHFTFGILFDLIYLILFKVRKEICKINDSFVGLVITHKFNRHVLIKANGEVLESNIRMVSK